MEKKAKVVKKNAGSGVCGFIGFLAFIGALVYFFQQANTFGEYVMAVLKAIIWPGILVYNLFKFLQV